MGTCNHYECRSKFCPECGEALRTESVSTSLVAYLRNQAEAALRRVEAAKEHVESAKKKEDFNVRYHERKLASSIRKSRQWSSWLKYVEDIIEGASNG